MAAVYWHDTGNPDRFEEKKSNQPLFLRSPLARRYSSDIDSHSYLLHTEDLTPLVLGRMVLEIRLGPPLCSTRVSNGERGSIHAFYFARSRERNRNFARVSLSACVPRGKLIKVRGEVSERWRTVFIRLLNEETTACAVFVQFTSRG